MLVKVSGSHYKGLSENQATVAGGERQIYSKILAKLILKKVINHHGHAFFIINISDAISLFTGMF